MNVRMIQEVGMSIQESVATKLYPGNFSAMSGKMAAIVGYIIGEEYVHAPAIAEITITSDGFALARNEGDCGCNEFLGSAAQVEDNMDRLVEVAELTKEEKAWVRSKMVEKGFYQ
jgi:hypothetical protein